MVSACAAAAVVSSVLYGNPLAAADPISNAQTQLDQLEAQRSAIESKYNDSQQRLTDAQKQQDQLNTDIAAQQAQLDALKPSIIWIITMQRQTAGVNMTVDFLLNDTEDGFLSQMSTMDSVTNLIDGKVAQFVSEQGRLNDLESSLEATTTQIQTEANTQKQLLADAQAKVDAQQRIVNKLTAQQRAQLQTRQAVTYAAGASYTPPALGATAASAKAIAAMNWALAQKGKAYVYGGAGPNSFDCSGLTMMAYRQVGISLPHGAKGQAKMGTPVSRADLLPGDLVFFYNPIGHVGIYIGDGLMINAMNPANGVRISSISANYNTARRIA